MTVLSTTALFPATPVNDPLRSELFRLAWRGFGASVALLATEEGGARHAMLATAVTSVSMEPPLLLVCVTRSAGAHDAFLRRGAFTLGILGAKSAHIARTSDHARFAQGDWRTLVAADGALHGLPWLAEAQATLVCRLEERHVHGTHSIFVARVEDATPADLSDPLLYCEGRFGRFEAFDA
ncbi:flavin reductase family protein [Paenirhodobacter sp.]|uniref:flavin reductase family protein n=1 Tax=Paenirhodobacter sp. TaxID=1965326 RepID=UPI003B3ECD5C